MIELKDKLGEDVNPLKIVLFIAFIAVLVFGLIAVFILHSHLLAFMTLPLVFIFFIIFLFLQYREIKSGKYKMKMDKLWKNTEEKYGKK